MGNMFSRPNLAVSDLPPASASDSGKVLTLDNNGVPGWANSQGIQPPELPEEDGAYVLTCTIASGVATLTWESTE